MSNREQVWGSDTHVSMPQPLENTFVEMVDMDGFCFTPDGLRVNATVVDRDEMIGSGYGPQGGAQSG